MKKDNKNMNEKAETSTATSPSTEDLKTIGQYLKDQRTKHNLSLRLIADKTKINHTQLEYLEKDQLDKLPNKTYVTGFIKSYCKCLNINYKKAMPSLDYTYRSFFPEYIPKELKVLQPEENSILNKFNIILASGALLTVALVVTLGILYTDSQKKIETLFKKSITTRVLTAKTPLKKESAPAFVKSNDNPKMTETKEIKEISETKKAMSKDNNKESVVEKITKKEEIISEETISSEASSETNTSEATESKKIVAHEEILNKTRDQSIELLAKKEIKFFPLKGQLYELEKNPSEDLIKKIIPSKVKDAVDTNKQNVYIKAIDGDTWVTYKVDNRAIRKYTLRKSNGLFLSGEEIRVFLGNALVTKIFLNNQPIKINSRTGVKSLVFTKSKGKKYYLPLFVFKKDGRVITSNKYLDELKKR